MQNINATDNNVHCTRHCIKIPDCNNCMQNGLKSPMIIDNRTIFWTTVNVFRDFRIYFYVYTQKHYNS